MPTTYNFVTGFGAVGNGTTDNGPAGTNACLLFNAQALIDQGPGPVYDQIILNIPAGNYLMNGAATGQWCFGIRNLKIQGGFGGGTTVLFSTDGSNVEVTGPHYVPVNNVTGQSPLIESVSAGSDTIRCITRSEAGNVAAGGWVIIYGLYIQPSSFPPSPQIYEFAQVSATIPPDTTSGIVTLTAPLQNSYSSSWPNFSGFGAGSDHLGPAQMFIADPDWDAVYDIHDLTIGDGVHQFRTNMGGRTVTFTNVTWSCINNSDTAGIAASTCLDLTFNNCTQTTGFIEVDKLVGVLDINGGTFSTWSPQSSSCGIPMNVSGLTISQGSPSTNPSLGCAVSTVITDTVIGNELGLTASGFGISRDITIENTTALKISFFGSSTNDLITSGNGWSISGGVIRCTKSLLDGVVSGITPILGWAAPNFTASFAYCSAKSATAVLCGPPFLVTDIVDAGSYIDIHTNLGAGFNGIPTVPGAHCAIFQHPCSSIYVSGCSGEVNGIFEDLGQSRCQNRPFGKVSSRTYAAAGDYTMAKRVGVFGKIVSVKIVVSVASDGATKRLHVFGNDSSGGLASVNSSGSITSIDPVVDVSVLGTRYIYPGSVVTQPLSSDNLSPVGYAYIPTGQGDVSNAFPNIGPTLTGSGSTPTVTIEIITDQAWLPTFNSVTPNTGKTGTSVIIDGHSFTGATSVTFGGVSASFTVVDDFTISATAPEGPGLGACDISVVTPNGTSVISMNDVFVYSGVLGLRFRLAV